MADPLSVVQRLGESGVVGCDHSALTRGHVFGGIKAECDSVATGLISYRSGPDLAARIFSPSSMGGVLHHAEPAPAGDIPNGVHIARKPCQMHRNNGARSRRDRPFNLLGIDIAIRANIRQYRGRACVANRMYRGAKS